MTSWEYLTLFETRDWDSAKSEFEINFWISAPGDEKLRKVEDASKLTPLLNQLGEEGWELIGQLARQNGILMENRGLHTGGVAVEIWHTFKRPKVS